MNKKQQSVHHIIAKEKKLDYNVECEQNKILLPLSLHQAIHKLFENKTPQEQIEFWYSFTKSVLSKMTRERIKNIISMEENEFYINNVFYK